MQKLYKNNGSKYQLDMGLLMVFLTHMCEVLSIQNILETKLGKREQATLVMGPP